MNKRSVTKDEQYLLALHRIAGEMGDMFGEVDRYKVGQAIGQNNKSVDNIVRILTQTHFIKKGDVENAVFLTPHGLKLVETLLEN